MNTKRIEEPELLARARDGDDLAVRQLLLPHIAYLSRFIANKYPRLDFGLSSVDDIVQETLGEAYGQIDRFDPSKASLRTWLTTIADRRAMRAIQAEKRIKRGGNHHQIGPDEALESSLCGVVEMLSAGSHTASKSAVRRETVEAVRNIIAELPEDYRQAVNLRMIEGKSLEEVGKIMSRSPRAVQGLVDRAKSKMRTALGRLSRYQ